MWNEHYKTPFLLKKCSAAAGFAVSVMRQTHPARDTELSLMKQQEDCFTVCKPTCTGMAIRATTVLQHHLLLWSWRNADERMKHEGRRNREKSQKTTKQQIKAPKEGRSCLLFIPVSLGQRNSSLGFAGKQLLSLRRQCKCGLVINA